MRIEAIIFDCDGTLVDSEELGHELLVEYLAELGARLSVEEVTGIFRGVKMAECIARLEEMMEEPLPEDFHPELRKRTYAAFRERLRPMEGAAELLQTLSLPICVASSGPREKIELSLSLTGLLPFFAPERIFSSYEVGIWKPDPGLFLHAAEAMSVPPSACVVVEDSLPGIHAGLAAGMRVFALLPDGDGGTLPEEVRIVRSLSEFRSLLATVFGDQLGNAP